MLCCAVWDIENGGRVLIASLSFPLESLENILQIYTKEEAEQGGIAGMCGVLEMRKNNIIQF